MNWLTKLLSVNSGTYRPQFVAHVFGVIGMCCSVSVLADQLVGSFVEPETSAWMDSRTEAMSDADLSVINGKGVAPTNLDGNNKIAVILWDERGNSNRRGTGHDVDSRQNFQSVSLTVNNQR